MSKPLARRLCVIAEGYIPPTIGRKRIEGTKEKTR